ncbi:MAG: hypothetical protein WC249_04220 [Patescibacteria group bacterium]|jgi:hypothetical protein
MKKTLIGPILAVVAIILVGAMFVYFYISLNRLDSKLMTIQTTTIADSGKITSIVNFFNAGNNSQTNAQANTQAAQ